MGATSTLYNLDSLAKQVDGNGFPIKDRLSEYYKNLILTSYPVVSGPVEEQLSSLLQEYKSSKLTEIHILKSNERNAFCLPSGDVFITTSLLENLKSKDQLFFILGHEESHITKSKKSILDSQSLPEYLHHARLEEYLGDLEGFKKLNKIGNPLEGISTLESIAASEKRSDLVHGDTTHRILNLYWVTRLLDMRGLEREPQHIEIDLKNIQSSKAPNLKVFENLTHDFNRYLPELDKCKDLFSTIAVYQKLMNSTSSSRKKNMQEDYDDGYVPPLQRDNIRDLKIKLFDLLIDNSEKVLEQNNINNSDKTAFALAEIIKTFCCGDIKPQYGLKDNLLEVMNPKYFNLIKVVPTFTNEKYIENYALLLLSTLPATLDTLKKDELRKTLLLKASLLTETKRLSSTAPAYWESDEFINKFYDIFEEGSVTTNSPISFTNNFKKQLEKLEPEKIVRELLGTKEIYEMTEEYKDKWDSHNLIANVWEYDLPITPDYFKKRGLSETKSYLEWLKVVRAALGSELSMWGTLDRAFENIRNEIKNIDTIKDFEEAVRIIKGDAVKEAYKFVNVERLDESTESQLIEELRALLIKGLIKKQKWKKLLCTLEESFKIHMPAYTGQIISNLLPEPGSYDNSFNTLPEDLKLKTFFSLLLSPIEAAQKQRELIQKYLEQRSFDEALEFITNFYSVIRSSKPFEYLLEDRAKTTEELDRVKTIPSKLIDVLGKDRSEELSELILFEFINKHANVDRLDLIKATLDKNSDARLKKFIYESAIEAEKTLTSRTGKKLEDIDLMYQMAKDRKNKSKTHLFVSGMVDQDYENTYTELDLLDLNQLYNLDIVHKYALTRVILADNKKGLLTNKDYKKRLSKEFLEELVEVNTETDKKAYKILDDLFEAYVEAAPLHQAYFTLMPLLLDNCFNKPKNISSSRIIVADSWLEKWFKNFKSTWDENNRKEFKRKFYPNLKVKKLKTLKQEFNLSSLETRCLSGIIHYARQFPEKEEGVEKVKQKLSIVEFLNATARNLGSPGVRTLQLLGQFENIPHEYSKEFYKVYDDVRGQSKITAYQTTIREYPNFRKRFKGLEKAVGGGSLSTVYLAETINGEKKAVKVLNPNAKYLNSLSFEVLEKILADLSKKEQHYSIGSEILEDIKEWINKDTDFTGFRKLDREFYKQNNNFQGINDYKIKVPVSELDNKFVKIEEFIEGHNLTQLETLVKEGHDLKAINSTIAKNYLLQLKQGLVHSDVHPGNFRVTKDKEIAILDRNFFLQFDISEQEKLNGLFMSAFMQNSETFNDYLMEIINQKPSKEVQEEIKSKIDELFKSESNLSDKMVYLVRHLRAKKIKMPLKMTLLIRNLHSLNIFAQDAGFSGLEEALTY